MPVIPALGRWKEKACEFEGVLNYISEFQVSLSHVVRPSKNPKPNPPSKKEKKK
jgi:hypothetical protein